MSEILYRNHNGVSYSKLQSLNCPRKFQIQYLNSNATRFSTMSTAQGSFVGTAIQNFYITGSVEQSIINSLHEMIDYIDHDDPRDYKKGRSFYHAMNAFERWVRNSVDPLHAVYPIMSPDEWEIFYVPTNNGMKPSIELEFDYVFNDVIFEGHVDLMLRHKSTKQFRLIELKTLSSNSLNELFYKNSYQTDGYAFLADKISELCGLEFEHTAYYVTHLNTISEWKTYSANKNKKRYREFLMWVQLRAAEIAKYKEMGFFPRNGDRCMDYFKPCEFNEVCFEHSVYKPSRIKPKLSGDKADFVLDFDDLVRIADKEIISSTDASLLLDNLEEYWSE